MQKTLIVLAVLQLNCLGQSRRFEWPEPDLARATTAPAVFVDAIEFVRDCPTQPPEDQDLGEGEGWIEGDVIIRVVRLHGDSTLGLPADEPLVVGFQSSAAASLQNEPLFARPTPWSASFPWIDATPQAAGCLEGVRLANQLGASEYLTYKFNDSQYCVRGTQQDGSADAETCAQGSPRVGPWADWEARRAAVARGEP
jgi:hypothetical protein